MEYLLEKKINCIWISLFIWKFVYKFYSGLDDKSFFEQITPKSPDERGCHLSIKFVVNAQLIYEELNKNGIIVFL